jgi:hypothetical protein
MIAMVVPVMARIRQARRQGHYREEGGSDQKPCFGHLESPEVGLKTRHFWPVLGPFYAKRQKKVRKAWPKPGKAAENHLQERPFLAPRDA